MVALKLIITLALVAMLAPTYTYSAAITDQPDTTVTDITDDNIDNDDGPISFWDLVKWIREYIWKRQQQIINEFGNIEAGFSTELCDSADNTGECQFTGFKKFNENCTIYTIGNCANFTSQFSDENCVHKCKLPTADLSTTALPTEPSTTAA